MENMESMDHVGDPFFFSKNVWNFEHLEPGSRIRSFFFCKKKSKKTSLKTNPWREKQVFGGGTLIRESWICLFAVPMRMENS